MTLTKEQFRKECIHRIKNRPKHNRLYLDKKLNQKLIALLKLHMPKRVLFYIPLAFEANIKDALLYARKKHKVFTPFMLGESFKMVPFRLPLKKKKFGIFEAGNSLRNIKKIDIAIVPALGVDADFKRVGFGRGMYDRFFAKLESKPFTIFVQPTLCYTKERVCDGYDVSCDLLLSPVAKLYHKRKEDVKRDTPR